MARLLKFYQRCLPEPHCQALSLVALFRAPVGEDALSPLWEKLLAKPAGDRSLASSLEVLHGEHLLSADSGPDGKTRYACHPILRDHFRAQILSKPTLAHEAAKLLVGRPDVGVSTREEVQIISTAIEVELEAGEVEAANDLYSSRLNEGKIFLWLPAFDLGVEVARAFVRTDHRREAVANQLSNQRLAFYFNAVALFSSNAGDTKTPLEFYSHATEIYRRECGGSLTSSRSGSATTPVTFPASINPVWLAQWNLSACLGNLSETETSLGMLDQAADHAAEALSLAKKYVGDWRAHLASRGRMRNSLASQAYVASQRGNVFEADADFLAANAIEKQIHRKRADLYGLRGIYWAEHLFRTGREARARELTHANVKICERNSWQLEIARCHWILGSLETLAQHWLAAHTHLDQAKLAFTGGHMIRDLAHALLTESLCHLGESRDDFAMASCVRALDLAGPRNYRLIHADALNLRARIALDRRNPDPSAALDDAEAALDLAKTCQYAWAQRDAAEILARAYRQLANEFRSLHYQQLADKWNRRLTPPATT